MADILNYLENSTLIANIVSFVVLGITGVLMRAIISAIASIAEQRKDLDEKSGLLDNLTSIAHMTYQTSLMYKNAIINSNLPPEAKNQALEIFNKVDAAYRDLLPELQERIEEEINPLAQAITEQFTQIGQDALTKLKNKIK
jgi:F0F1-type ATP synthase membrane subunit b/b'